MNASLYPIVVAKLSQKEEIVTRKGNASLFPPVVARLAPREEVVTRKGNGTLYPPVVARLAPRYTPAFNDFEATVNFLPQAICRVPPDISSIMMINDGKQGFVAPFRNGFVASYVSDGIPTDIIGNYSYNGQTWTPAANNTDPPSHFIEAIKDLSQDCVFYPTFDEFGDNFSFSWLENTPYGKLNLKYADVLVPRGLNTFPASGAHNKIPQEIYIHPKVVSLNQTEKTQNIPMSDIKIIDISNDELNIDTYQVSNRRGYNFYLPDQVKSVLFTQFFREAGTIECNITTAPIAGTATTNEIAPKPISNFVVNVYYGKTTFRLLGSYQTDINGVFQITMKPGNYTFELPISTNSINFSQKLL